jgi:hypothetical protein
VSLKPPEKREWVRWRKIANLCKPFFLQKESYFEGGFAEKWSPLPIIFITDNKK